MRSLTLSTLSFLLMFVYTCILATPTPSPHSLYENARRSLVRRHSHLRSIQARNATTADVDVPAPSRSHHRRSGQCKSKPTSALPPSGTGTPAQNVAQNPTSSSSTSKPKNTAKPPPTNNGGSRLDMIRNMHAFSGFVYAISSCPSASQMLSDFKSMASKGARTVITFDACSNPNIFGDAISAAGKAGIKIIPLAFEIGTDLDKQMSAVISAVKANPDPVLAVAIGDEPLFSGYLDASSLTSKINFMRSQFKSAGLNIPISTSEMAYGWQQHSSAESIAAPDFFMVNNFPYFAPNAQGPADGSTWNNFKNDISYFEGIAKGRPILVTQTGWPSDSSQFPPSNKALRTSVSSEQAYFDLLDSHCADFFAAKNIGWMWRNWDDSIPGWGVKDGNGHFKFNVNARTSC